MKRFTPLLALTVMLACKNNEQKHTIYGNWSVKFKSGPQAEVRFRNNGSHDYYVDGKLFSSGKSVFLNDTLKTYDPICKDQGEYYGTYKIDFLEGDSIRFTAIADSCEPRRYDMDGAVLHRLQKSN